MGVLRAFDLSLYKADCFVETGTQKGMGLDYALQHDYKELHSIEINEEYYNFCAQKYKFVDKVKLHHGDTETKIGDVLADIEKFASCFFWLDAHLPSDPGSQMEKKYTCTSDKIEFPLEAELQAIRNARPSGNDIILIDDLRIYLDGPFQYPGHTWPHHTEYPDFFPHKDGIKFIEEMFESTHDFHKIYNHEGYLLLLPKSRGE